MIIDEQDKVPLVPTYYEQSYFDEVYHARNAWEIANGQRMYATVHPLFGTNLNAAEMNTIVGYVYDMLYGDSGGYPSYASAAAIILFAVVFTITMINLSISKKNVHY